MMRPQLSVLHTFGPKAALPALGDRLWLIERGMVRTLTWTADGHVTTLGIWGQGDVVGVPLTRLSPFTMECLTPVAATEMAVDCHGLQWQELLLDHLWHSQDLFRMVQTPCLAERLLQLLHWLGERFGYRTPEGVLLPPVLTHQQLSEVVGSSRVTVTRLLNALEGQGRLVRFTKRNSGTASLAKPGASRAILLPSPSAYLKASQGVTTAISAKGAMGSGRQSGSPT